MINQNAIASTVALYPVVLLIITRVFYTPKYYACTIVESPQVREDHKAHHHALL